MGNTPAYEAVILSRFSLAMVEGMAGAPCGSSYALRAIVIIESQVPSGATLRLHRRVALNSSRSSIGCEARTTRRANGTPSGCVGSEAALRALLLADLALGAGE